MVMNFWTRQQSAINSAEQSQHSFDSSSFTSDGLLRASQTSPSTTTIHLHSHTTDDDGNRERDFKFSLTDYKKAFHFSDSTSHARRVSKKGTHISVRANALLSLFYVMTTYSSATKDEDNSKQASKQHRNSREWEWRRGEKNFILSCSHSFGVCATSWLLARWK